MPFFRKKACLLVILVICSYQHLFSEHDLPSKFNGSMHPFFISSVESTSYIDPQVEIVKQQIWENLKLIPGTSKDYSTTVTLGIANGNVIDATCKIVFPETSWELASIIVSDYQDVLKKTNTNIFAVIYKLIIDPNVLASEINITGLWRPFVGTHVHIEGRGMDIGNIRSSMGSGVIFNSNSQVAENDYGKAVRESLTSKFPLINEYLSPWFICSPSTSCKANQGVSDVEKGHTNHLHLTLSK